MQVHALTAEQVQKFLDAVGGVPRSIAGNQFTTEELRKLAESAGGFHDFPKITDDPQVNFAIDCVVEDEGEEPTYDEQLYAAEVEVCRAHSLFV